MTPYLLYSHYTYIVIVPVPHTTTNLLRSIHYTSHTTSISIAELELPEVLRQSLSMLGLVAGLAVHLAVLVQTSSASVEPVFSQVKIIVDTIGELTLESTLETRLMQRVNDYLRSLNMGGLKGGE